MTDPVCPYCEEGIDKCKCASPYEWSTDYPQDPDLTPDEWVREVERLLGER